MHRIPNLTRRQSGYFLLIAIFRFFLLCLFYCYLLFIALASCATSRKDSNSSFQSTIKSQTSLEGDQVKTETIKLSGIEIEQALSEDGTSLVQRPFKWYAGIGTTDNKQLAIELAQREAYATISRILNNAVLDSAQKGNVVNNGNVKQELTSHWEQVSSSLTKACEPFGSVSIEYNPTTKMYTATAKVAIRGDRFNQLLNSAGEFKPSNLSKEETELFIKINKDIMKAAKGE